MTSIGNVRRLRFEQTQEEIALWNKLRASRFAGFKFRRQHPIGKYSLDFYCPAAKLAIELDGFNHGSTDQLCRDRKRKEFLERKDIQELRFWNHQWNRNSHGVLLEIWRALHRRTGCVKIMRQIENHRFIPPGPEKLV
jgi:very-short-patch-repair endonuclease